MSLWFSRLPGIIAVRRTLSNFCKMDLKHQHILVEKRIEKVPFLYEPLRTRFTLNFYEDLNCNLVHDNIVGIIGGFGLPLVRKHLKNESLVLRLPNLKVVSSSGTGTDHLDLHMLWKRGVRVSNTPDVTTDAAAEFGMTLLLSAAKNLPQAIKVTAEQGDDVEFRATGCGSNLLGSTLGIVGLGSMGCKIAERAAAFKMKIVYHNRNPRTDLPMTATYCPTLDTLLINSDYMMLCTPLTDETRGMIGSRELKLMKPTAALINISRGAVVNHDALTEALQKGEIAKAALDVTDPQPLPRDHPLLKMPNVIVTKHFAGFSKQSVQTMSEMMLTNFIAGLNGEHMPNEIKPTE